MRFSELVVLIKPFCKNPSVSNEAFVNDLLACVVLTFDIRDKNNNQLLLDKSRVSHLLHGKFDIPRCIRTTLFPSLRSSNMLDAKMPEIQRTMQIFVNTTIRNDLRIALYKELIVHKNIGEKAKLDLEFQEKDVSSLLSGLLVETLLNSLQENNAITSQSTLLATENNELRYKRGDILKIAQDRRSKRQRIIVIPVDTTFSTRLSSFVGKTGQPGVSPVTLHGQWLLHMLRKPKIEDNHRQMSSQRLRGKIIRNLGVQGLDKTKSSFPIGTIAEIQDENRFVTYFLVAISNFDEQGRAYASKQEIQTAVNALMEHIEKRGQGFDVYLPLIGTGMSRSSMTKEESKNAILHAYSLQSSSLNGTIYVIDRSE